MIREGIQDELVKIKLGTAGMGISAWKQQDGDMEVCIVNMIYAEC